MKKLLFINLFIFSSFCFSQPKDKDGKHQIDSLKNVIKFLKVDTSNYLNKIKQLKIDVNNNKAKIYTLNSNININNQQFSNFSS